MICRTARGTPQTWWAWKRCKLVWAGPGFPPLRCSFLCRVANRVACALGFLENPVETLTDQVGMLDEVESGIGGHLTLTGVEFGELAPLDQASAVARLSVFARVEPSHKSALVDALREQVCCARCVVACLVVYIFSKNINHAVQTRVSCPNFPSP